MMQVLGVWFLIFTVIVIVGVTAPGHTVAFKISCIMFFIFCIVPAVILLLLIAVALILSPSCEG